jgi:hypothetical protein
MAAKTWSSTSRDNGVDELLLRNDTVSLCLLVNRRHRTLRVIDFRAGPTSAKRNFVIAAAQREGVEKVFTLVERDEVATWTRLGFTREGSIPAFYKRSDAWILGAVVAEVTPLRASAFDEDDDDDDVPAAAPSAAALLADRTIHQAKKLLRDTADSAAPTVKLAPAREADVRKAITAAQRANRALSGLEPFGRDAERSLFGVTTRGGVELWLGVEAQSCFGSSAIDLVAAPRTEPERLALAGGLRVLADQLLAAGAASAFTIAPADDVRVAAAFLAAGFKKTAVLARHLVVGRDRKDAIVWSRKLAAAES